MISLLMTMFLACGDKEEELDSAIEDTVDDTSTAEEETEDSGESEETEGEVEEPEEGSEESPE